MSLFQKKPNHRLFVPRQPNQTTLFAHLHLLCQVPQAVSTLVDQSYLILVLDLDFPIFLHREFLSIQESLVEHSHQVHFREQLPRIQLMEGSSRLVHQEVLPGHLSHPVTQEYGLPSLFLVFHHRPILILDLSTSFRIKGSLGHHLHKLLDLLCVLHCSLDLQFQSLK